MKKYICQKCRSMNVKQKHTIMVNPNTEQNEPWKNMNIEELNLSAYCYDCNDDTDIAYEDEDEEV